MVIKTVALLTKLLELSMSCSLCEVCG